MHHLRQCDCIFWLIEKSIDSNSLIVLWSTFIDQVWRACVPWSRIAVRGQLGEFGFFLPPSHGCQALNSGCQPGEYTHVLLSHLAGPLSVVCTYDLGIYLSTGLNLTFLQTTAIDLGSDYNRRFLFSRWSHQTFTPLSFFFLKKTVEHTRSILFLNDASYRTTEKWTRKSAFK